MLEVVKQQERRRRKRLADMGQQRVCRGFAADVAQPQPTGQLPRHRVHVADRSELQQVDPPGNASSSLVAVSRASRVLPLPPAPVSVNSRTASSRRRTVSVPSSDSRPTSGVLGAGSRGGLE